MSDDQRLQIYNAIGFVTKALLVANSAAAAVLAAAPSYWIMSLLGLGLLTQSSLVLYHRHVIMDEYVHELDGKNVGVLRKPSNTVYRVNIYLVWPLLFVGGLALFIYGAVSL